MTNDSILKISNLKAYLKLDSGILKAVDGVDLIIPKGKVIGLLGESGCGKTMTALSILKILPPVAKIVSGSIEFEGKEITRMNQKELEGIRGKNISMIFQEPFSSLNPVIKIGKQMQDVILVHKIISIKESRDKTYSLLEKVNLKPAERYFESYSHQLSGGERQRIMIAMAISLEPKLLIADEPTSALDVTIQKELLKLLVKLKDDLGLSILFITHDLRIGYEIADFVYVMYLGSVVEEGEKGDLFKNPLHPYTKGLLDSIPQASHKGSQLPAIKGLPADILHIPSGCPFHPRCPIKEDKCKTEFQELETVSEKRKVKCWKASL